MKNNIIIITIIVVTIALFAAIVFTMSDSNETKLTPTADAKAVVKTSSYDWGEVGINDGDVVTDYEIKNEGSSVLKLYNLTTSCSCTTARYVAGGKESPLFGMHSKSKYVQEVQPGESVKIKAIYDPLFHGPTGIGSIDREIIVETNDASNPKLVFKMFGEVRK